MSPAPSPPTEATAPTSIPAASSSPSASAGVYRPPGARNLTKGRPKKRPPAKNWPALKNVGQELRLASQLRLRDFQANSDDMGKEKEEHQEPAWLYQIVPRNIDLIRWSTNFSSTFTVFKSCPS